MNRNVSQLLFCVNMCCVGPVVYS